MALEGTLQDFALVDILQLVGMQRKTGTLTLTRNEEAVNVVLQDGMVVWAAPRDEIAEADLGRILVHRGLITRERWEEARQIRARKGQPLVPFLAEGRWLSPRDLEPVLQRQVLETLYRALRWRDGRYTFVPQVQVDLHRGQISPVGTETILLEAVRQMDEWPLVEQRIPSLDLVVRRSDRPLYREQVPPEGLAILQLVEGQRTVRDIAELCDFGEFDTYKNIADLVAAGVLQLERRDRTAEAVRSVRLPWRFPAWVFPVILGAVMLASLLIQFSSRHDPLHLLPSQKVAAEAAVQTQRLHLTRWELPRALDLYLLKHGGYPDTLTALQAEGLLTGDPQDPWGRSWVYERRGSGYRLTSPGADGRAGTADDLRISPSS